MAKEGVVYVVTRGDYSDYEILGVYDDKALADMLASTQGGCAEKWVLNTYKEHLERGLVPYRIWFKEGNADIEFMYVTYYEDLKEPYEFSYLRGDKKKRIGMCILARDKEHAAKIAMEKRTRWILERG